MSKVRDEVALGLPEDEAAKICRQAVAELGWRVLKQTDDTIVVKEVVPTGIQFTWAAEVTLRISGGNGDTTVALDGKIAGVGPIQKGHLRGQLGALKNQIQVAAEAAGSGRAPSQAAGDLGGELERLAGLRESGALSEEEFAQAKTRLLGG